MEQQGVHRVTRSITPDGRHEIEETWRRSPSATTASDSPWICIARTIRKLPERHTTN